MLDAGRRPVMDCTRAGEIPPGGSSGGYRAMYPPSMYSSEPVTNDASSLAR